MNARALRHALAPLLILLWPAVAGATAEAVTEAQALVQKAKYAQALDVLDDYLSSAPQDAEARFTRGLVLVRLDRTDDAIKAFSDLTREYPQLPEPYNNLAVLYAQRGNYDKARDALEAALASHPSYVTAHENLGDIYAALAAAAYGRAVTLDPANKGAKTKLKLLNQMDSLADSGAAVTASPAAAVAAVAPPEGAKLTDADAGAIRKTLKDWAGAWSAQDVEKYLGFYADDFAPEAGMSRQAWAAQRRSRVGGPEHIKVEIAEPEIRLIGENRVEAVFQQDYESNVLTNVTTKVLELKNLDGTWRIVREYSR